MTNGAAGIRRLMAAALQAHQAQHYARAEDLYRRILADRPDHVQARHYLGMVCLRTERPAEAETLVREALTARPSDGAILANLGLVLLERRRHDEAVRILRRAVSAGPDNTEGWYNLGLAETRLGLHEDAERSLRRALQGNPDHDDARIALAGLLLSTQRPGAAERVLIDGPQPIADRRRCLLLGDALVAQQRLTGARDAVAALLDEVPEDADGLVSLSGIERRLERYTAAEDLARRAVALAPGMAAAHRQLGLALKEQGRLDEACASFEAYLAAGRMPDAPADPELVTYTRSSMEKLAHDAEQIEFLRARELLPPRYDAAAAGYRSLLAQLPADAGSGVFVLPARAVGELGWHYNRLNLRDSRERVAGGAVNPGLNRAAIQADYRRRAPGITWVDDFLTPAALSGLRRFCLRSTIWFDFNHNNGYLGAYLEEGFFCPLLLQVAEDLRAALPRIFADHPVTQMWAYKYSSRPTGIDMHADFAAVNVNFWITPSSANLDPTSGGLVVWDVEAPPDQSFAQYNSSEPDAQRAIADYLDARGARPVTIPYRENRAVIFNSDLFHKTDVIHFRPGYENRRINVTMLFGRRERNGAGSAN